MARSSKAKKKRAQQKATATATAPTRIEEAGPVYHGAEHDVVHESDPEGKIVAHAVRRDATVVDRLFRAGSLGSIAGNGRKLHQAGERFRVDFERARLMGHFGTVDLLRTRAPGTGEISDGAIVARERVRAALAALGYIAGAGNGSMQAKAAWWVIGEQVTLDEFAGRMRGTGQAMTKGKAAGLVIAALERLAVHYGEITLASVGRVNEDHAHGRGILAAARILIRRAERCSAQQKLLAAKADQLRVAGDATGARKCAVGGKVAAIAARTLREASLDFQMRGQRMLGTELDQAAE